MSVYFSEHRSFLYFVIVVIQAGFNMMSEISFNIDHGYLEGLVRGFKGGILKQSDYVNLVQCETLEGECNVVIIFRGWLHFGFGI